MNRPVESIAVELECSTMVLVVTSLVFAMNVTATIVTLMMA